jgi:hypothetical protein
MKHEFQQRIEEALERYGGLYKYEDLLDAIQTGELQSFADGNAWVVTRICQFPQKRILSIEFAIGDLESLKRLEKRVADFAKEHGCSLLFSHGRVGFEAVKTEGWRRVASVFVREV